MREFYRPLHHYEYRFHGIIGNLQSIAEKCQSEHVPECYIEVGESLRDGIPTTALFCGSAPLVILGLVFWPDVSAGNNAVLKAFTSLITNVGSVVALLYGLPFYYGFVEPLLARRRLYRRIKEMS